MEKGGVRWYTHVLHAWCIKDELLGTAHAMRQARPNHVRSSKRTEICIPLKALYRRRPSGLSAFTA